jgi:hypothetical protein
MPIMKDEVLRVLRHPSLSKINFSVGAITVDAEGYRNVAAYVDAEDIKVVPGTEDVAFYDGHRNTITTPAGNPPLEIGRAAQLLHECTHAIVDIDRLDVLRLDDEVAAYLAQLIFMRVAEPGPFPRPLPTSPATLGPLMRLMLAMQRVIYRYNLHTSEGFGARISELDIAGLRRVVHGHPEYQHIQWGEKGNAANLGVPVREREEADDPAGKTKTKLPPPNSQIGRLRHALLLGKRDRIRDVNTYSPSPRFGIF